MRSLEVVVAFTLLISPVCAENWISSGDDEIDAWYARVQRQVKEGEADPHWKPGGRCCGKADAYFADKTEVIDGKWIVTITDDRVIPNRINRHGETYPVDPDIVDRLRQGNPTGHVVIFVLPNGSLPYCFFPGEGV